VSVLSLIVIVVFYSNDCVGTSNVGGFDYVSLGCRYTCGAGDRGFDLGILNLSSYVFHFLCSGFHG
jgi:hypothetical protein